MSPGGPSAPDFHESREGNTRRTNALTPDSCRKSTSFEPPSPKALENVRAAGASAGRNAYAQIREVILPVEGVCSQVQPSAAPPFISRCRAGRKTLLSQFPISDFRTWANSLPGMCPSHLFLNRNCYCVVHFFTVSLPGQKLCCSLESLASRTPPATSYVVNKYLVD